MFAVPLVPEAYLRPLEPWRAEEFLAHLDRGRDNIATWVGTRFVATDLDSARAVLRRHADDQARDAGGIYGIWLENRLVGGVMFVTLDSGRGTCEVGCWLESVAVGPELATRAAEHLIDWAVRERGIDRVEWHCLAGDGPSAHIARRLGMGRDTVPPRAVTAQAGAGAAGQGDLEVWSVLGDRWLARTGRVDPDKRSIDALTARFFHAFSTVGGARPAVETIYDMFIAEGRIARGGPDQQVYDVDQFVQPRRELLVGGELTEFHEEETAERTEIAGDVAQRISRYRKAGVLRGAAFEGRGTKMFQFLRTPAGWRITGLNWYDEP